MIDVVNPATRSRMMAGIKAKNTHPELFLRKSLHALGFRYRLHAKDIPGKPDMVFPKYSALIEIRGCFWHGHGCRYCKPPITNSEFWQKKIMANQLRDKRNLSKQIEASWRCLIVWECAVRQAQRAAKSLDVTALSARWLQAGSNLAIIDEQGLHNFNNGLEDSHVF
jgi:DNA mismatch endonuclease (patch repair protein)